ncbi:unnamed protein product [Didymodactylos carnosus]|uniref:Uncharacterized protein n=1 Tax=Didymodactylos carnosus TaxID=1234261 RepID=A0A815UUK8_9BILA|nr:unnamed protein product [Didymodactylos carnosus]CAF1527669.1 unnamed protein product [Didymodactylos carnosus]CAF3975379.1 unnamed protein product [Didymodactylos carnosus]CAF4386790.1 unnamed protein product [Didymodactylos carnosus]
MPAITNKPANMGMAVQSGPYTKAQFQSTMEGSRTVKTIKEIENLLKDYPAALDLYKTGKYKVKVKCEADVERVILVEKRSAKGGDANKKSQKDNKQNSNIKVSTLTNDEQVTATTMTQTYDQQDNESEDTLNDNNNKRDHSTSRQSTDHLSKHSKFNGDGEHHRHSRTHSKDSRNCSTERPPPFSSSTQHVNKIQLSNNYQSHSSGKVTNGTQQYENGHSIHYSKDKDVRKSSKDRLRSRKQSKDRQSDTASKKYGGRSTSNDSGRTKSRHSSKNRRQTSPKYLSNSSLTSNNTQNHQQKQSNEMMIRKTVIQHRASKGRHDGSSKAIHEYMPGKVPALPFRKTKWNPGILPLYACLPHPYWPSQQNIFAAANQSVLRPFQPNLCPIQWQPSRQQVPSTFAPQRPMHPALYYGSRPNVQKPSVRSSTSPPQLNTFLTASTPSSVGLRSHHSGRPKDSNFSSSMYSAPIANNFRFHHPGNAYVMNGQQVNSVNQSWFNGTGSVRNGWMSMAGVGKTSLQADYKRPKHRAKSVDTGPGLSRKSHTIIPMSIRDQSIEKSLNNQQKHLTVPIEQYRHHSYHHHHHHQHVAQNHYQSQPIITNGTVNEQKPGENGHSSRNVNGTNGGITGEKLTIRQLNETFQQMNPTGRLPLSSIASILQNFNMSITENELTTTAQQLQYNSKNNVDKTNVKSSISDCAYSLRKKKTLLISFSEPISARKTIHILVKLGKIAKSTHQNSPPSPALSEDREVNDIMRKAPVHSSLNPTHWY